MIDDQRWRSPSAYLYAAQLDLSGWAWEFLRRNPAYRADAARPASTPVEAKANDNPDGGATEPGTDWGLHFRPNS